MTTLVQEDASDLLPQAAADADGGWLWRWLGLEGVCVLADVPAQSYSLRAMPSRVIRAALEPLAFADALQEIDADWAALEGCASSSPLASPGWVVVVPYEAYACTFSDFPPPDAAAPLVATRYDWVLSVERGHARIVAYSPQALADARQILTAARRRTMPMVSSGSAATPRWDRAAYEDAFNAVKTLIREGEVYQANLTMPFTALGEFDAASLFIRGLAAARPSHGAFFYLDDHLTLVSLSPESFLRAEGSKLLTSPIKGTRARGSDEASDLAAIASLTSSAKENAELTMIVDLMRNDLSRISKPGSVRVTTMAEVMTLPNVHHLFSTIAGELEEAPSLASMLMGLFPGGSITGCPKRRMIERLASIEGCPRGYYTGSLFVLGGGMQVTSSILIRTIVVGPKEVKFGSGGGIVWDSVAEDEWQECFHKTATIVRILRECGPSSGSSTPSEWPQQ